MNFTYDEDSFSDLYKDVYGFRPRQNPFYNPETTPEERQQIWDSLCEDLDRENKRIEEERQINTIDFEKIVQQNIKMGSVDRKTAIQWLVDAEGDDFYDYGYMEYNYGLPYGYIAKEFS